MHRITMTSLKNTVQCSFATVKESQMPLGLFIQV